MVNEINSTDEFTTAIGDSTTGLVVIDFWAKWCGPCVRIAPFFSQLSSKYSTAAFYKVNVDLQSVSEVVSKCEINAMPTFCFFVKGNLVDTVCGADPVELEKTVKKYTIDVTQVAETKINEQC